MRGNGLGFGDKLAPSRASVQVPSVAEDNSTTVATERDYSHADAVWGAILTTVLVGAAIGIGIWYVVSM